ncbi:MAG: TAXI family TRAP transporter solute-binding subunit [Spirochaetia bacterium]
MKKITIIMLVLLFAGAGVFAQNLSLKSARQTSTYYAFAVGIAEALDKNVSGLNMTVETSAGSVENVKMARTRRDYLFTSPPSLVQSALDETEQFEEGGYERIRSLWPIPGLVMHWVVREDSGIETLDDLEGNRFIPGGKGSAGARITNEVLEAKGIKSDIDLLTLDLGEGVKAVRNRRAVGFSTSSTPPASMVQEIASTISVRLLSLSDEDYSLVSDSYTRATIPADMYPGVDSDVKTISLPVAMYTTEDLPEDTAYELTKAFWENRDDWEGTHPAMEFIQMENVNAMKATLHPGAARYYEEIDFDVDSSLQ